MTSQRSALGTRPRWTARKVLVTAVITCLAAVLLFGAVHRTMSLASGSDSYQNSGATETGAQHRGQGRGVGGH